MVTSNSKISKCHCPLNQYFYNESCYDYNESINHIQIQNKGFLDTLNISDPLNISVKEIICPEKYVLLNVTQDPFIVNEKGNLVINNKEWSIEFSEFCLEDIFENDIIVRKAEVCLLLPSIPICCGGLTDPDTCDQNLNHKRNISFMLDKDRFSGLFSTHVNNLICGTNGNLTHLSRFNKDIPSELIIGENFLHLSIRTFYNYITLSSSEFCVVDNAAVNGSSFDDLEFYYCKMKPLAVHQDKCDGKICIRKCCTENQVFDKENFKCSPSSFDSWMPTFHDSSSLIKSIPENIKMTYGFPIDCEFYSLSPRNDPPEEFSLLSNGSLLVEDLNTTYGSHQYCLDHFIQENTIEQEALVCFEEEKVTVVKCESLGDILYPIILIVSCLFLSITLIVYSVIPDIRSKIQGKCIIGNVSSLFMAYTCLIVIQLVPSKLSSIGCTAFGLLTQFSTLASFFWLNVMSYDIWRSLRAMKSWTDRKSKYSCRYLCYSIYAWGCPAVISIVTGVMQYMSESLKNPNLILPQIGEFDCLIAIKDPVIPWVYLYGFISIILIINIVFFVHLIVILAKSRRFSENSARATNQMNRAWAKLYIKLFLVMGITWVFEVASWVEGSCAFWMVTDIINSSRGFLIFVIFVCKKDIIKKILARFSPYVSQDQNRTRFSSSLFSRSSRSSTVLECISNNEQSHRMDTAV